SVFELMDDPFYARVVAEIPIRCHGLNRDPAPELPGAAVLLVFVGAGIREAVPAGGADKLLAVNQRGITSGTGLYEKKGCQIVEETFNKHRRLHCRACGLLNGQLSACGV